MPPEETTTTPKAKKPAARTNKDLLKECRLCIQILKQGGRSPAERRMLDRLVPALLAVALKSLEAK